LGLIVSEGTIHKSQVRIPNTDVALLDRFDECCQKVFGLGCKRYVNFNPEIHAERPLSKKKSYELVLSKTVTEWLDEMGALPTKKGDKPMSHYKEVPWSILQADENCWYGYLAGFIEGDGCLGERLQIISSSTTLLDQTQSMLNALGFAPKKYATRIEVQSLETQLLSERINKYLVSKKAILVANKARNRYGIPNDYWAKLINDRKVKDTRHGSYFVNDDNQEILIKGFKDSTRGELRFLYDRHDKGQYDTFLGHLKDISASAHKKLVELLDLRYRYTPITEITKGGKQHVYDISMAAGTEPAFVANGIINHNTYNNMETALSVFIEQLRTWRSAITNKIFYHKVFPMLARVHGFVHRSKAEIDHRIRINRGPNKNMSPKEAMNIPMENLIMPEIQWHKQLRPEADANYLDILERMEEKGIPVSLRTWSAAGGIDLKKQMETMEDDMDLRLEVQKKKAKLESYEGSEDNMAFSSFIQPKVNRLPIWDKKNKCGELTVIEARDFCRAVNKERPKDVSERALHFFSGNKAKAQIAQYVAHRAGLTDDIALDSQNQKLLLRNISECDDSKRKWQEVTALNRTCTPSAKHDKKQFEKVQMGKMRDQVPLDNKNLLSGV